MRHFTPEQFKSAIKNKDTQDCTIRKILTAVPEVQEDDREIKFTISTDGIDRDNDKINQKGWKLDNFLKNPCVLWSHQSSEPPIAKVTSIGLEDGNLKAVFRFVPADNPFNGAKAEGILQMCKQGFLSAVSVGFAPIEWTQTEDKTRGAEGWSPGIDFERAELFEVSVCSIPSNPEALIEPRAPKSLEQPVLLNSNDRARRNRILSLLELEDNINE